MLLLSSKTDYNTVELQEFAYLSYAGCVRSFTKRTVYLCSRHLKRFSATETGSVLADHALWKVCLFTSEANPL